MSSFAFELEVFQWNQSKYHRADVRVNFKKWYNQNFRDREQCPENIDFKQEEPVDTCSHRPRKDNTGDQTQESATMFTLYTKSQICFKICIWLVAND